MDSLSDSSGSVQNVCSIPLIKSKSKSKTTQTEEVNYGSFNVEAHKCFFGSNVEYSMNKSMTSGLPDNRKCWYNDLGGSADPWKSAPQNYLPMYPMLNNPLMSPESMCHLQNYPPSRSMCHFPLPWYPFQSYGPLMPPFNLPPPLLQFPMLMLPPSSCLPQSLPTLQCTTNLSNSSHQILDRPINTNSMSSHRLKNNLSTQTLVEKNDSDLLFMNVKKKPLKYFKVVSTDESDDQSEQKSNVISKKCKKKLEQKYLLSRNTGSCDRSVKNDSNLRNSCYSSDTSLFSNNFISKLKEPKSSVTRSSCDFNNRCSNVKNYNNSNNKDNNVNGRYSSLSYLPSTYLDSSKYISSTPTLIQWHQSSFPVDHDVVTDGTSLYKNPRLSSAMSESCYTSLKKTEFNGNILNNTSNSKNIVKRYISRGLSEHPVNVDLKNYDDNENQKESCNNSSKVERDDDDTPYVNNVNKLASLLCDFDNTQNNDSHYNNGEFYNSVIRKTIDVALKENNARTNDIQKRKKIKLSYKQDDMNGPNNIKISHQTIISQDGNNSRPGNNYESEEYQVRSTGNRKDNKRTKNLSNVNSLNEHNSVSYSTVSRIPKYRMKNIGNTSSSLKSTSDKTVEHIIDHDQDNYNSSMTLNKNKLLEKSGKDLSEKYTSVKQNVLKHSPGQFQNLPNFKAESYITKNYASTASKVSATINSHDVSKGQSNEFIYKNQYRNNNNYSDNGLLRSYPCFNKPSVESGESNNDVELKAENCKNDSMLTDVLEHKTEIHETNSLNNKNINNNNNCDGEADIGNKKNEPTTPGSREANVKEELLKMNESFMNRNHDGNKNGKKKKFENITAHFIIPTVGKNEIIKNMDNGGNDAVNDGTNQSGEQINKKFTKISFSLNYDPSDPNLFTVGCEQDGKNLTESTLSSNDDSSALTNFETHEVMTIIENSPVGTEDDDFLSSCSPDSSNENIWQLDVPNSVTGQNSDNSPSLPKRRGRFSQYSMLNNIETLSIISEEDEGSRTTIKSTTTNTSDTNGSLDTYILKQNSNGDALARIKNRPNDNNNY